jgi:transcriptional regulator with XRE-family HTH domain
MAAQTLGSRIRELRQARGYSMRELTSRAKLKSVAFIADLEKGYRNPSPEVLANLAVGLGVPLEDLRSFDRRAPLHEIAELAEKDAAWAAAFRAVVDAANSNKLTPKKLQKLLETPAAPADSAQQPLFNL